MGEASTTKENVPTTGTSENYIGLQMSSSTSSENSREQKQQQQQQDQEQDQHQHQQKYQQQHQHQQEHHRQPPIGETSEYYMPAATTAANRSRRNLLKNVFILSGMWGLGLGAAYVQFYSAKNFLAYTGHHAISTVLFDLIIFLSVPCAVVVPKLISKFGDKKVFVFASLMGLVGALVQMSGELITQDSGSAIQIALLMIGAAMQSFTYASTNNIRFAVAYFSTPEFLPQATALVVLGGALGPLIGRNLINLIKSFFDDAQNAGNFLHIALLYLLYGILTLFADFSPPQKEEEIVHFDNSYENEDETNIVRELRIASVEDGLVAISTGIDADVGANGSQHHGDGSSTSIPKMVTTERSLREILTTTDLALLIFCQSFSYNIMGLYMADVRFPMDALGYTDSQGRKAILAHVLGMFLPSIFSGHLIGLIGTWPSTILGFVIFLIGGMLFLADNSVQMFTIGIAVIGVGWNISFVAPSAKVSKIYKNDAEKSKVQGLNDGLMLLSISICRLSASSLYEVTDSNWYRFAGMLMVVTTITTVCVAIKITEDFIELEI